MRYIEGISRKRKIPFPEYIDDYITEDNPVRVIDAFVDSLDLDALGFEKTKRLSYKNNEVCNGCKYRDLCTKSKKGRVITRTVDQDFLDTVDERTSASKELYKTRQMIVEHPFGTIKRGWGISYFLTRGIESVKAEVSLAFLTYNIKRIINILGVKEILKRLKGLKTSFNLFKLHINNYWDIKWIDCAEI